MKRAICLIVFIFLLSGCATTPSANLKVISPQQTPMVYDEKYGTISEQYFVYRNPDNVLSKRGQVNLSKIFSSYQKTKEYSKILQNKENSHKFSLVELKKDQDDRIKEIFRDIEQAINNFANKNKYKAIYADTMPNCSEEDLSDKILGILNSP